MNNILDCREIREVYQRELLQKYSYTLIVIRSNYPGAVKGNIYSNYAAYKTKNDLVNSFDVLEIKYTYTAEGLIYFVLVSNCANDVKLKCIEFEDLHPLGRLVDIDVYDSDRPYSRHDYGISPRKCYICNEDAVLCVRSMKHSYNEVRDFFSNTVVKFVIEQPIEFLSRDRANK